LFNIFLLYFCSLFLPLYRFLLFFALLKLLPFSLHYFSFSLSIMFFIAFVLVIISLMKRPFSILPLLLYFRPHFCLYRRNVLAVAESTDKKGDERDSLKISKLNFGYQSNGVYPGGFVQTASGYYPTGGVYYPVGAGGEYPGATGKLQDVTAS
jgi:hypothetical protein